MTDREIMQQALEALELLAKYENPLTKIQVRKPSDGGPIVTVYPHKVAAEAAAPLRERLADSPVNQSLTTGSCIACGNRMTGSPEHFVVGTAEVGVTAPEGYSPQQVEALHLHKGGDKTAPPLVNRIADILVEDHIALMTENKQLRERLAQPEKEPVAWCPDVCPITGLPFFMWIEHHETGQKVPTYGGPYDSYTIPVRDKDGSYCRERYDHDLGGWLTDEVDDVGVQIVSDQAYVSDEPPANNPWVGLTEEEIGELWASHTMTGAEITRAIEAKLRERNA